MNKVNQFTFTIFKADLNLAFVVMLFRQIMLYNIEKLSLWKQALQSQYWINISMRLKKVHSKSLWHWILWTFFIYLKMRRCFTIIFMLLIATYLYSYIINVTINVSLTKFISISNLQASSGFMHNLQHQKLKLVQTSFKHFTQYMSIFHKISTHTCYILC